MASLASLASFSVNKKLKRITLGQPYSTVTILTIVAKTKKGKLKGKKEQKGKWVS